MTKLSPDNARDLISLLGKQLNGLKTMLDILHQEYDALKKNDRQAFDKAVDKKQLQAQLLEELEVEFKPVLELMGGTFDKKTIDELIASMNGSAIKDQLTAIWDDFIDTLNQCQEQNKINHRILEASRINVQQVLDILLGENSIPKLYSASGKQSTGTSGHSIAVA